MSPRAVRSIPTNYRGISFRSRLEARWAVFLDTAGFAYDYEPTHLVVSYEEERLDWLPDFRLRDDGRWAEVKGALPGGEFYRLMDLAYAVSATGDDVIVLGHLPEPDSLNWPVQLHRDGSDMWAVPWQLRAKERVPRHGPRVHHADISAALLLGGLPDCQPDWAEPGLSLARQARFPWG